MTTTTHADIKALLEDVLPILKAHKDRVERRIGHFAGAGRKGFVRTVTPEGVDLDEVDGDIADGLRRELREVNTIAERVIATIGTLDLSEPRMPALLLDCPRASDADASATAPTVPRSFIQRIFNIQLQNREGNLVTFVYGAAPLWLESSSLATSIDADRGRLLTFCLKDEEEPRVLWVNG